MSLSSLIIILILFSVTAFASATEMAVTSINRFRLKAKVESGDKRAACILKIVEDYDRTITSIVILNNIVNIILPTITTILFVQLIGPKKGPVVSTVVMTILILVFGEILPKIYGKEFCEQHLNRTYQTINVLKAIFKPITFGFLKLSDFFKKIMQSRVEVVDNDVEEELLTMIEESKEEGQLESNEEELIRNAIEFSDTRVEEIYQPLVNMISIDLDSTHEEILQVLSEERYSRIPVYEGDQNNIIGLLSEREFLMNYIRDNNFKVRDIIRDTLFVPDSMRISKLLPELQQKHIHLAIVIDERATVQGLITAEDILEELVGEIWDEHDEVVIDYRKISDDVYELAGEYTITDFNDLFDNQDIESATSEQTIAGYVIEIAEKIPEIDEVFEDELFEYQIVHKEGNKIEIIRVTKKTTMIEES